MVANRDDRMTPVDGDSCRVLWSQYRCLDYTGCCYSSSYHSQAKRTKYRPFAYDGVVGFVVAVEKEVLVAGVELEVAVAGVVELGFVADVVADAELVAVADVGGLGRRVGAVLWRLR